MRRMLMGMLFGIATCLWLSGSAAAAQLPSADQRAGRLIDADHFQLRMKQLGSVAEIEQRKEELRQTVLRSSGLWPLPEKTPLNARVFDEKQGQGFRVAKVYFESLPGYYATGNLWLPAEGDGPFPAVVCPHGHWYYGRLTNSEDGSLPGRYIDLARMGFVVISLDMVGYNDNLQFPHDANKSLRQLKADVPEPYDSNTFRGNFDFPRAKLYGLSLAGLQVWNAIRAVDFLCTLPQVDTTRIAATGASGGASQTLFLMTADQRIKVAAPVNIIGAEKHPGCGCENMPGAWVEAATVELAACFAPRPLILISATEDPWTNSTPTRELPLIRRSYELYGAADKLENAHLPGGHNYNAQSRAAVYKFFAKHLQAPKPPIADPVAVPKLAYLGDLRVFPDHLLPDGARDAGQIIDYWQEASERQFAAGLPRSAADLKRFTTEFGGALAGVLHAARPAADQVLSRAEGRETIQSLSLERHAIGRADQGEAFTVEVLAGSSTAAGTLVFAAPEERGGFFADGNQAAGLAPWAMKLASQGYRLVRVGGYASGELSIPRRDWEKFSWPEAYNRSNQLNGIQDLVTALAFAKKTWPNDQLTLAGLGQAGLLAGFAGAVFGEGLDRTLVDLDGRDPLYDGELLELLPVGSLRRTGDFRTAALLLMPRGLTLANPAPGFDRAWLEQQAGRLGLADKLVLKDRRRVCTLADLL